MANIECKDCGDLVDVEARTVTLPFVCKWCEEGFTSTTPRYIIQYEGYDGWIRSENTDACGVFDDFSVASAVAVAETYNGGGLVYRVVPYGTPDEYSETGGEYPGFDTQEPKSGSDEVCHCIICEPEVEPESESEGIEDQFELDTKLIEDLSNQLAEANKQIEIKDARIRVLETEVIEGQGALDEGQSLLKNYRELLQGLVGLAKTYQFEEDLDGLTFALESREKTIAVLRNLFRKTLDGATTKDVKIKSLENSLDYYKKIYNRLYKDFSELETRYTVERDKTWWERLWS